MYYGACGEPDPDAPQAGLIERLDPRTDANMLQVQRMAQDQKCFFKIEPGLMIMFPSWLRHMVHPDKGEGTRISIAFNAMPILT